MTSSPQCRECSAPLTEDNWFASYRAHNSRLCRTCSIEKSRARDAAIRSGTHRPRRSRVRDVEGLQAYVAAATALKEALADLTAAKAAHETAKANHAAALAAEKSAREGLPRGRVR